MEICISTILLQENDAYAKDFSVHCDHKIYGDYDKSSSQNRGTRHLSNSWFLSETYLSKPLHAGGIVPQRELFARSSSTRWVRHPTWGVSGPLTRFPSCTRIEIHCHWILKAHRCSYFPGLWCPRMMNNWNMDEKKKIKQYLHNWLERNCIATIHRKPYHFNLNLFIITSFPRKPSVDPRFVQTTINNSTAMAMCTNNTSLVKHFYTLYFSQYGYKLLIRHAILINYTCK